MHLVRCHMQGVRNQMLHLTGVLGGAMQMHGAVFLGDGVADLAFQIKLLLPAYVELTLNAMRRLVDSRACAAVVGAARQMHGRQHVLAQLMGFFRGQHRHSFGNRGHALGQRSSTARSITCAGNDGEQGLAHIANLATAQNGVVLDDGAAVVDAGDIGSNNHVHHIRHGAYRIQRQRGQGSGSDRRQAQRAVQRALQLRQIVNIRSLACYMQMGRFMLAADAHAGTFALGLGLGFLVDAEGRVLAVISKRLCKLSLVQFTGMIHLRLLALRC